MRISDWSSDVCSSDDIKAQLGATIVHRVLTDLFNKRGVRLDRTYQLNTGGNTDFLNMTNRKRLASKKKSKTEAVQSVAEQRQADENNDRKSVGEGTGGSVSVDLGGARQNKKK